MTDNRPRGDEHHTRSREAIGGGPEQLGRELTDPSDELMDLDLAPDALVSVYLYRYQMIPGRRMASRSLVDQLDHVPEYASIGEAYGGGQYEMVIYKMPERERLRTQKFTLDSRFDQFVSDEAPAPISAPSDLPAPASPAADPMTGRMFDVLIELVKTLASKQDSGGNVADRLGDALDSLAECGGRMIERSFETQQSLMERAAAMNMGLPAVQSEEPSTDTEGDPNMTTVERLVDKVLTMLQTALPMFKAAPEGAQQQMANAAKSQTDVREALRSKAARAKIIKRVRKEYPEDADRILQIFGLAPSNGRAKSPKPSAPVQEPVAPHA